MKNYDVLVVGELNVDIILDKIQGFPEIGKEILSKHLNVTLGSSSAIFASNLSSLGTSVTFLGKIGNDMFSTIIKESLERKKVNTDFIIGSEEYQTGLTMVMNYDMDRANVTFPGAMEHLYEEEVTDDILKTARHLHLSSIFLQTGILKNVVKLFKRAKKLGLTTSMDPQWDPSELWNINLKELLPHIDVFLPNAEEFKLITGCETIASGIEKVKSFSNIIVIKDGARGAHLWNPDSQEQFITMPAFLNKDVADCIGAGDSFDAGFVSSFLEGKDLKDCLRVGNITGAINTTASGGTTAFEDIETIKKIAKTKFSYNL
ncbi:MAG: carbohydrate kinase family protein [Flavobacteriaceae bacterium]